MTERSESVEATLRALAGSSTENGRSVRDLAGRGLSFAVVATGLWGPVTEAGSEALAGLARRLD